MLNSKLEAAKKEILQNIIEAVIGVISQKKGTPVKQMQFNGSAVAYAGDVGLLISALINLHDIFELEFNLDLNRVSTDFATLEQVIGYFLERIVDEKIINS